MRPLVLIAALLQPGAAAVSGSARCPLRLAASDFGDPRLESALERTFARGGPALRLVRDSAETRPEAYRVEARPDGVVVSAGSAEGAFRGLLAATPACRAGRWSAGSFHGAPAFAKRGVLEGFYGKPWTWEERRAMVDWLSRRRMNLFVIAPKDDPLLRADWRRPMPEGERAELARLAAFARERFVDVAWTLSPGLDLEPKGGRDLEAARAKIEAAAAAGVRQFVLAFDDVDPWKAHGRFANRLVRSLEGAAAGASWTFVPAEYWGEAAPSPYLSAVGRGLDERFRVGWTGGQILPRAILADDAARFRRYIRHALVLGDNFPVQDRLWGAGRLQWGPLAGREAGLESYHEAFVANASPLAAASRLPLATAADYAWDPGGYRPEEAWRRALEAEHPGAPGVALFAAYNAASWIDPGGAAAGAAPRRFAALAEDYAALGRSPELEAELKRLAGLPRALDRELAEDPGLRRQLEPWTAKLAALASAALAGLQVEKSPARSPAFEREAAVADALPAVVAGQALDRLLHRQLARLRGLAPPDLRPLRERVEARAEGSPAAFLLLAAALDRLEGGPAALGSAAGASAPLWRDALPWVGLLGEAAGRARAALDGKSGRIPAWLEERLWRWRARRHFIALAAARSILEDFLAREEGKDPGELPAGVRAWLAVMRRRAPERLPCRLAAALESRRAGDAGPLRAALAELAALPAAVRAALPGQLAEEGSPWLDKVGEYGRLGLLALDGGERGEAWEEARYRLRSANGLELMLELKLELDALRRWALVPAGRRPARPESRMPADPRDLL